MMTKRKKGFTLIELLVVVAIIGVLAGTVLSSLNQARANARDAKRLSEMKQIQNALELYHLDNGEYPRLSGPFYYYSCNTQGDWGELVTALSPYMSVPLTDISGNTTAFSGLGKCYIYRAYTSPGTSNWCAIPGPSIPNSQQRYQKYCLGWANETKVYDQYHWNTYGFTGETLHYHQLHSLD